MNNQNDIENISVIDSDSLDNLSKKNVTIHEELLEINEYTNSKKSIINDIILNDIDPLSYQPYDTLVLSGGSIKGILTLGGLQFAEDNFMILNIKRYIGTSAGSIICYLLAIGYKPIEIMVKLCTTEYLDKMKYFDLVSMISGIGAISYNHINDFLEKMTLDKLGCFLTLGKLLEKTGKSLTCVTYNDTKCQVEYISSETHPDIPCLTAIRMSSNLPLVFGQFKYMNCYYDDGGLAETFPILYGEKLGNKVLGFINILDLKSFNQKSDNIIENIYKKMFIPVNELIRYKLDQKTSKSTVIELSYNSIHFLQFNLTTKDKMDMFSHGYQTTKSFFTK